MVIIPNILTYYISSIRVTVTRFEFQTAVDIEITLLKARLHGSPRLINTIESMKLNSTVERNCLQGSTKVNEVVDFKMAANELVREGVVVICDYLIKECQHLLEKRDKRKKRRWWVKPWIMRPNIKHIVS